MIYTGDNKHRNNTFITCINVLDRAKGCDAKFDYIKTDSEKLTLGISIYDKAKYAIYFGWEDLAKAVGKAGQDIDFEKLTHKQYLKLCKYIVKEIWRTVKMSTIKTI